MKALDIHIYVSYNTPVPYLWLHHSTDAGECQEKKAPGPKAPEADDNGFRRM